MSRLRINSQESLSAAIRKLSEEFKAHKYLVVSYRIGKDRTLDQNALWFAMYERIAQMTQMGDVEDVRRYCKFRIGAKILYRDEQEFREGWQVAMEGLPYHIRLSLMGSCGLFGPEGMPITRLFSRKQGIEYTDSIVAEFAPKGVVFDDLLAGE